MKNVEFYAKELASIAAHRSLVAVRKSDGVPCPCYTISCCDCLFEDNDGTTWCKDNLLKWAKSDIMEYEVDWSKVPVDTPVYCQANICQNESPGYFAKFNNGIVYIWRNGRTSFTSLYKDDICSCQFVRLVESHPEWMKRKERENK